MAVPSLMVTLTRLFTSVVNWRLPASGALVAGVKVGPDEMVNAWDNVEKVVTTVTRKLIGILRVGEICITNRMVILGMVNDNWDFTFDFSRTSA